MAEPKITGAMRIVDGSTNLRTLKELNTNVTNLTTRVTSLENQLPKVTEAGTIMASQMTQETVGGTAARTYTLKFKKTYTTPPTVMVTTYNTNRPSYGIVDCQVANVTNTQCVLVFFYSGNIGMGLNYTVISNG